MIFKEITAEEFDKFEHGRLGGGFYQKAKRAIVRRKMGWNIYFLAVLDGKKIRGAGLMMERRNAGIMQLGPLLDDYSDMKLVRTFLEGVTKFAKAKNWITVEVFPPVILSVRDAKGEILEKNDQKKLFDIFAEFGFKYEGATIKFDPRVMRWLTVKDLSGFKNIDEARASYKKNTRNKLRKNGPLLKVELIKDKSQLPEWIKPLNSSNKKNGVENLGRGVDYYEDIWDAFGDQAEFMSVKKKDTGETIVSRLVLYFPEETITFSSGTIQEFKQLNGMTVLQDWQIGRCIERGIKRINFYGVEGDFTENNRLLTFKSEFGIVVEEYIGGFRKVLRPVRYNLGRAKRKAASLIKH